MVNVIVHCPRCQSAQIYRHEVSSKGRERFRDCHRVFILIYTYESRKPSVKKYQNCIQWNRCPEYGKDA